MLIELKFFNDEDYYSIKYFFNNRIGIYSSDDKSLFIIEEHEMYEILQQIFNLRKQQ